MWGVRQEAVSANWAFDILQNFLAEIDKRFFHAVAHLFVGCRRETEAAGFAKAFEARRDINAVAHQVAVDLLDDIAEVDSHAKLDATFRGKACVAFGHRVLQLEGAAHRVNDTAELHDAPIPSALHDAPVMDGDGGINEIAAKRPQPGENPLLVGAGEPRITDDVCDPSRPVCALGAVQVAQLPPCSIGSRYHVGADRKSRRFCLRARVRARMELPAPKGTSKARLP